MFNFLGVPSSRGARCALDSSVGLSARSQWSVDLITAPRSAVFRCVITDLKLRSSPGPLTAAAIPDAGRVGLLTIHHKDQ